MSISLEFTLHRPWNCAARFSRNADVPSFLSSVAAQIPKNEASSAKPSAWLVSNPLFTASSEYLNGDRGVGEDLFQDRFGTRDEIRGRDDFVDQANAISFGCIDHLSGKNELKSPALPHQPGQALRAAAAWKKAQLHFGLAELCVFCGDSDGASHGGFAATAEREAVDCSDHRLAEILDEIQDALPEAAGPFCFDRSDLGELADVRSRDEGLVAGTCQNGAAHLGVIPRFFKSCPKSAHVR